MDDIIGVTEAARRLGVSKEWIQKLCAQGRIPGARKVGKQWVLPPGAKIEPTGLGRPLRTLEIPRGPKKGEGKKR